MIAMEDGTHRDPAAVRTSPPKRSGDTSDIPKVFQFHPATGWAEGTIAKRAIQRRIAPPFFQSHDIMHRTKTNIRYIWAHVNSKLKNVVFCRERSGGKRRGCLVGDRRRSPVSRPRGSRLVPRRPGACSQGDLERLDHEVFLWNRITMGLHTLQVGLDRFADVIDCLVQCVALRMAALQGRTIGVIAAVRLAFENDRVAMCRHRLAPYLCVVYGPCTPMISSAHTRCQARTDWQA
jgi:hypothetical protein